MACVAVASALASATPALSAAWRFDRRATLDGEWWRMLSGHFMHWDAGHWIANLLAAAAIWHYANGAVRPATWLAGALASALATSFGLLLFSPGIQHYGGLSGALHGMLACAALARWRGEPLAALVLAALAAKIAWEQWQGPLFSSWISVPVAVDAHLYGVVGGGLLGLAVHAWQAAGGRRHD